MVSDGPRARGTVSERDCPRGASSHKTTRLQGYRRRRREPSKKVSLTDQPAAPLSVLPLAGTTEGGHGGPHGRPSLCASPPRDWRKQCSARTLSILKRAG